MGAGIFRRDRWIGRICRNPHGGAGRIGRAGAARLFAALPRSDRPRQARFSRDFTVSRSGRHVPLLATDYHTFGIYVFAVVNNDLPDELVYKIIKTVFEHHQELVKEHPAAKETLAANVDRGTFLPLHSGALRCYREIGVKVPDHAAADSKR